MKMQSIEPTPTELGRMCVIMNGKSGRRDTQDIPSRIRTSLTKRAPNAELRVLESGSDLLPATRKAVEEGFDMIVAAGGDGTVSGVASVLRGTGVTMGILPLGTFNYFARSLDIPTEIPAAIDLLCDGAARPVRIARINDRVFLNNASLGAYPAILKTREDVYRRWGRRRIAAYWSVLVTLVTLRRPLRVRVEADDQVLERRTPLIFAVNNAFQLNQIGLQGEDEIARGRLALFIAPDTNRWGMLRNALLLALGLAEREKEFDFIAADRIRIINNERKHDIACDGERDRMKAPYDLQVIENELKVVAPLTRQSDTR
ncbi:diacylglycerol/lipid kinase family protein [Roseovarius sp.]|uniref:diacylglycerol/lipid kinase family protein n=1 Tax=Roseovarius sp. TaxID=1486281 RepID=UPI003BACFC60